MVKLYKDLGKTAKKLLNDDFIFGSKKVELKTKTDSGMTYTTTGIQKTETDKATGDRIDKLSGDLSCKYSMSGCTMTTKVLTSDTLTQEVTLDNTGVKGLKLTLFGSTGAKQVIVGKAEYEHPHISCTTAVNALGSHAIQSSLAIGSKGVTLGVDGEFDVEKKELKKCDGVLNYSDGTDQEVTLAIAGKDKKAKFTYSHLVSRDFSVAAEFAYDKNNDSKLLTMATKYLVDRDTTLKAKIESSGTFSLSYLQEIRSGTTLTLCSRFDVRNLEKTPHTFGIALVIE